jgi:hypothetical protein
MVRPENRQEFVEIVGLGESESEFLQQGLEVLLGTLDVTVIMPPFVTGIDPGRTRPSPVGGVRPDDDSIGFFSAWVETWG